MDNHRDERLSDDEEAVRQRRRQRIQEMKREKERRLRQQAMVKRFLPLAALCLLLLIGAGVGIHALVQGADSTQEGTGLNGGAGELEGEEPSQTLAQGTELESDLTEGEAGEPAAQDPGEGTSAEQAAAAIPQTVYTATTNSRTTAVSGEVVSSNAIFIDLNTDTILAERDAHTRISPASMTKILTVLVAAEHVTDLDDTFTITIDITDYSYVNDCSNVGFEVDETVTVRDLFYGTILPSGADAAVGLANYVAGSQEAFVELMNQKLEELGLSDSAHFTNCVGLYDEDHYCTVYDMAMILKAAVDNEFCREVLSAHTYTTSSTTEHPVGITISNWFLRRIEDKDTYGEVLCGKTGYVVQSGSCAASYGLDTQGGDYICVTAHSNSSWRCIYDHVELYQQFLPSEEN